MLQPNYVITISVMTECTNAIISDSPSALTINKYFPKIAVLRLMTGLRLQLAALGQLKAHNFRHTQANFYSLQSNFLGKTM